MSHEERACCESGDTEPSDSCPAISSLSEDDPTEESKTMIIAASCVAGISILAIAFVIYIYSKVHRDKETTQQIMNGQEIMNGGSIGAPSDTGESYTISVEEGNGGSVEENIRTIVERLNSISESINGNVAMERLNSISSTVNGDDTMVRALDNATRISANTILTRGSTVSTMTVDGDKNDAQLQQQQNDINEFVSTCQYLLKYTKGYSNLVVEGSDEENNDRCDNFFFVRVGRLHDGEVERVILYKQGWGVCTFGSYCREVGKRSTDTNSQMEARFGNVLLSISEGGLQLMAHTLSQMNCALIEGDVITLFPGGISTNYNEQQKQSDHALFQVHATRWTIQHRMTNLERAASIAEHEAAIAQRNGMKEMEMVHIRRGKSSFDELKRCSSILSKLDAIELCLQRSLNDSQIMRTYNSLKAAFGTAPGLHNDSVDELMAYIRQEMDIAEVVKPDNTNVDEKEFDAQEEGRQEALRVMEVDLEARLNNLRRIAPQEDNRVPNSAIMAPDYPDKQNLKVEEKMASHDDDIKPTENDVIFGRGWITNTHKGNVIFKDQALKLRSWYEASSTKEEKSKISDLLLETVKSQGHRFLELGLDGKWHELTDNEARKMAKQALKAKQRSTRSGLGNSNTYTREGSERDTG